MEVEVPSWTHLDDSSGSEIEEGEGPIGSALKGSSTGYDDASIVWGLMASWGENAAHPSHGEPRIMNRPEEFRDGGGEGESGLSEVVPDSTSSDSTPSAFASLPVSKPMTEVEDESSRRRTEPPPPRKTPHKIPESPSFIGVVITQSPSKLQSKQKLSSTSMSSISDGSSRGQDPVSALSHTFNNKSTISERDRIPSAALYSKRVNPVRRATYPSIIETRLKPRPIRPGDIQATLETRVAHTQTPRVGGRGWYDAEAWGNFLSGEDAERRRRVCLRFVAAEAHLEGQGDSFSGKKDERVCAVPSQSRTEAFVERLEKVFGPGSIHRGAGPKPKVDKRRYEGKKVTVVESESNSRAESVSRDQEPDTNAESEPELILGKRGRSFEAKGEDDRNTRMRVDDGGGIPVGYEWRVTSWSITLQKLIKGKTPINKEGLREVRRVLVEIDEARRNGVIIENTQLRDAVEQLSKLEEIPFGDEEGLRERAMILAHFWNSKSHDLV